MSSGRTRLRSGMVTDGVSVQWGGTISLSRGMDSLNRLIGDAIIDDPDNELTMDPEEERLTVSTDPDDNDERCKDVLTDPEEK